MESRCQAVDVKVEYSQRLRERLESGALLHPSLRPRRQENGRLLLPLAEEAERRDWLPLRLALQEAGLSSADDFDWPTPGDGLENQGETLARDWWLSSVSLAAPSPRAPRRQRGRPAFSRLVHALRSLAGRKLRGNDAELRGNDAELNGGNDAELRGNDAELWAREVPSRYERHGDLVVLPSGAFVSDYWRQLEPELWAVVASVLGANRVARCQRVAPDAFRSPRTQLMLGEHGHVEHCDNNITYEYDVTLCMFSKGNVSEKLYLASLDCRGETIVDLYAGIGYLTLPLLVHAGAAVAVACEWSPHAVAALHANLDRNGVAGRCRVHPADNQTLRERGFADRVLLGLVPSSRPGWGLACALLRPDRGGILHIHHNVASIPIKPPLALPHSVSDVTSLPADHSGTEGASLPADHSGTEATSLPADHSGTEATSLPADHSDTEGTSLPADHSDTEGTSLPAHHIDTEVTSLPAHHSDTEVTSLPAHHSGTEGTSLPAHRSGTEATSLPAHHSGTEGTSLPAHRSGTEATSPHVAAATPPAVSGVPACECGTGAEEGRVACACGGARPAWRAFARDAVREVRALLLAAHARGGPRGGPRGGRGAGAWCVRTVRVARVKKYAPHVDHVVLDLHCRPPT